MTFGTESLLTILQSGYNLMLVSLLASFSLVIIETFQNNYFNGFTASKAIMPMQQAADSENNLEEAGNLILNKG